MRIGIVALSGIYPIHIGGPGNVGYFLAKEFGRMGHSTTLLVRAKTPGEINTLKNSNEFKLLKNVKVVPILLDYNVRRLINPIVIPSRVLQCARAFHREKHDIVLFNSPPIDVSILLPFISGGKNTKQVIIMHGLFHSHGGLYNNLLGRLIIRAEKRLFDSILTPGDFEENSPLPCGFTKNQITVIPNGIPLDIIENASPINLKGSPRIIHAGVLNKRKGVDTLLKAIPLILGKFPETRIYLVGDGPERENLTRLSKSLGIEESVEFTGFLPDTKDVFRYIKSSDVFVMTSYKEAFGITLTEAMACRVPVISTDIFGAPRLLIRQGGNGLLFPPGDHEMLAAALERMLTDDQLRQRAISANYCTVKEGYTWRKVAEKYLQVFEELIS